MSANSVPPMTEATPSARFPVAASEPLRVLLTGGAGYIGSLLTGVLLERGHHVTVVDDLLFGGESLLAYFADPHFTFIKGDVCDACVLNRIRRGWAVWDATKPNGQPRRSLDTSLAEEAIGFRSRTNFTEGLKRTIAWYRDTLGPQPRSRVQRTTAVC